MNRPQSLHANKPLAALLLIVAAYALPSLGVAQENDEYRAAYECAMESLKDEYPGGPAAFCVGNSRDPSATEEKAYADAEKAFLASSKSSDACPFAYAVWVGNGSRADGFLEGPQRVDTLSEILDYFGRPMAFFDQNGQQLSNEVVSKWFVKKDQYEYALSDFAKQSCSPNKIGR